MATSKTDSETIDFGYRAVPKGEKQQAVHGVFASVASKYDIMNDFMSGGLHRIWKDRFVQKIRLQDGQRILDLAGGTGDITHRILKRAERIDAAVDVTLTDINEHMLGEGKARALDKGVTEHIDFKQVNAEDIPFDDNSFDVVTIAFGIRNVTDKDKALKEIYRVLKPSGQFLCLEFSPIDTPIIKQIYDAYSFNVIPKVGQMVAGDADSYQYLVESIRMFPDANRFEGMLIDAGFVSTRHDKMNHGVVAIHQGWKL